jgi:hypothetical protein
MTHGPESPPGPIFLMESARCSKSGHSFLAKSDPGIKELLATRAAFSRQLALEEVKELETTSGNFGRIWRMSSSVEAQPVKFVSRLPGIVHMEIQTFRSHLWPWYLTIDFWKDMMNHETRIERGSAWQNFHRQDSSETGKDRSH